MGQARTSKNSGSRNGRVIMHLDMDGFFVNVELLENPALRGEPIIVAPLGPARSSAPLPTRRAPTECTPACRSVAPETSAPTRLSCRCAATTGTTPAPSWRS